LASEGLVWLIKQATEALDGLVWTGTPSDDEVDPTLYSGASGIVLTLLEAHDHSKTTGTLTPLSGARGLWRVWSMRSSTARSTSA
jgi:hypothetical protein